jgi:hypothetical protein
MPGATITIIDARREHHIQSGFTFDGAGLLAGEVLDWKSATDFERRAAGHEHRTETKSEQVHPTASIIR